ncbi:MAG: hemerythrin domain-containing protein, partial [Bacteroidales bacterium]|nr:hemerythrin domain-containing protein [Bacteroidales bacterium]
EQMSGFPLSLILEYIRKSHTYYLTIKVPQIDRLLHQLLRHADPLRKKEFSLIEKFFEEYKAELKEHILDEEERVYPYVQAIDEAFATGQISDPLLRSIQEYPIAKFQENHTNVEDKLFDLKNIIIKYLPPVADYTISNALLIELFRLERDLFDHARIEEKVLVPKVQAIESEILKTGR